MNKTLFAAFLIFSILFALPNVEMATATDIPTQPIPKEAMVISLSELQTENQTSVVQAVYFQDGVTNTASFQAKVKNNTLYVSSHSLSGNPMFQRALFYPETDMAVTQKQFEQYGNYKATDIGIRYYFERAGYEVNYDVEKKAVIIYSKEAPVVSIDLKHKFPAMNDNRFIYTYAGKTGEIGGYIDNRGRLMVSTGYFIFPFDWSEFYKNHEYFRSESGAPTPIKALEQQEYSFYYDDSEERVIMLQIK